MARPSSRSGVPPGAAVRAAAATLVARVLRERIDADAALAGALPEGVAERDAALLAALVFGALRWHHQLEWQCERLLSRPLKAGQPERRFFTFRFYPKEGEPFKFIAIEDDRRFR